MRKDPHVVRFGIALWPKMVEAAQRKGFTNVSAWVRSMVLVAIAEDEKREGPSMK